MDAAKELDAALETSPAPRTRRSIQLRTSDAASSKPDLGSTATTSERKSPTNSRAKSSSGCAEGEKQARRLRAEGFRVEWASQACLAS